MIEEQRKALHRPPLTSWTPLTKYDEPSDRFYREGIKQISSGKVGCVVLAGGEGSRLGLSIPKALVPITLVRKKTLLQFICQKVQAASKAYACDLDLAIMTSPPNHKVIKNYLQENRFFGLKNVHLFTQDTVPFLNAEENWIYDVDDKLVTGPDGNGNVLKRLVQTGIAKKWKDKGIERVTVITINNPLAQPFDADLCGYHATQSNDISVKAIRHIDPNEKIGILASHEGKTVVISYILNTFPCDAPLAYTDQLCFKMSFLEKPLDLPWCPEWKKHEHQKVWKFEKKLFDTLLFSSSTGILLFPREDIYAPLTRKVGPDSFESVHHALLDFDKRLMGKLLGTPIPDRIFELDPAFYYPTPELVSHWRGKNFPMTDYIDSDMTPH